jgi:hypothetical protein
MQVKFLRNALVPVLGALAMNAATAASPFEGVDAKKYCLKQICLGDPLSSVPEVLKGLAAGNRLAVNPCAYTPLFYNLPFDASGTKYRISVVNDSDLLGRPVGEYYRIVAVQVTFDKALTNADRLALEQELRSRMQLNSDGRRNIVSSYKGLWPREIVLKSWPDSFEVYVDTKALGFDEIRAYEDAPGCKANKKPDL